MDTRIESALTQMEQQLAEPLSIATLAAGVNLSASRFAHLFCREVGTSPARYLHAPPLTAAAAAVAADAPNKPDVSGKLHAAS